MPKPSHRVEMRVGGELYGGWTRGHAMQSLDQFASSWWLDYVDEWTGQSLPWPIEEGDEAALIIDDEELIGGHVDQTEAEYSHEHRALHAEGRSYLGDLVDCDAIHKSTQWRDASLTTILGDLIDPFGISFRVYGDEGARFRRFKFEPGDSVSDVALRLARLRGFITVDAGGVLELLRIDDVQPEDHLMRGYPIKHATRTGSWAERFSEYRFRGQTQADDQVNGVAASQLKGVVEDAQVSRYRPKMVISGYADGDKDLGLRAILERNQRAGRSERISVTIPGFRTEDGALWRPGMGVHVADDWLRVDATLLVVAVEMEFGPGSVDGDDGAMQTRLELARPEAYGLGEYPLRQRTEKLRTQARLRSYRRRQAEEHGTP